MDENKFIEVGKFYKELNDIAGTDIPLIKIYRSKGFSKHLLKRKHYYCLKHIDDISDIINNPDYIGINPNEKAHSIEIIKRYKKNILVGIKLNIDEGYLYVSTMHDIQDSKLERRLHSGRIKKVDID